MCETEIIDCIQITKKHVYKERKETIHERVSERKTYINNIEERISTMYVYKWSQDLIHKTSCTRSMYLRKKRKDTSYPHYIPQKNNNTPP